MSPATKLIVGCPVRDRAWVMGHWFDHTHAAVQKAGLDSGEVLFLFVGDYKADPTFRVIDAKCAELGLERYVIDQPDTAAPYQRVWNWQRYQEMANLRNDLLRIVRSVEPAMYWSLDSDILVAPETLASAISALEGFDAVGSRCYMTTSGTSYPSHAMLTGTGGLLRNDSDGLFRVDVIMAAKLMSPKAYGVDYVPHSQGEDIGWSNAARKLAGCKLGWDGRTVSKHVMTPASLDAVDPRCGF